MICCGPLLSAPLESFKSTECVGNLVKGLTMVSHIASAEGDDTIEFTVDEICLTSDGYTTSLC